MNDELRTALLNLPENSPEATVSNIFIPKLLNALGFNELECVAEFPTGEGSQAVDYAVRQNTPDDLFIQTRSNPYLLVELKGQNVNLSVGSPQYKKTVEQLRNYLLSPNCKTVQWGIITNSKHLTLFRKHGKVVYPATQCLEITPDNILELVANIRQQIKTPQKALTVAIYNNKGGVGKTTTTVNLAATLVLLKKKVLVIDFDPNQQDLTSSLGIHQSQTSFYSCLEDKRINISEVIRCHTVPLKKHKRKLEFDVIPADDTFAEKGENELLQNLKISRLRDVLKSVKSEYDYILIDSPPNWRFFSVSAVYAADVVLIPTKHNNIFSLENAATAIQKFIPEVQQHRKDGGPVALPIFFNGEKITPPQKIIAEKAIDNLIKQAKKDKFDLIPYFYPRFTQARKDRRIFALQSYAYIANATFDRLPAAYINKTARDYYLDLAKEYFLQ